MKVIIYIYIYVYVIVFREIGWNFWKNGIHPSFVMDDGAV